MDCLQETPSAKKAARKDKAERAKAKAKARAEAKAAREAARKAEAWLEAGTAQVSLKGHRLNIGGQARKAAKRTENLRRKRLRAEFKAGAASGDEEVWLRSLVKKNSKHSSQAKTKLEAMRQKKRKSAPESQA